MRYQAKIRMLTAANNPDGLVQLETALIEALYGADTSIRIPPWNVNEMDGYPPIKKLEDTSAILCDLQLFFNQL